MHTTSHHTLRGLAVAFTVSVALAPAAAAQQDLRSPDTRDGAMRAEQRYESQGKAVERLADEQRRVNGGQDLRSPDARDAARESTRPQDLRMPDTRDWAAGRGPEDAPRVEFVEVAEPNSFDWGDAGMGAAAGIGLVLIGSGTALTAARIRRRSVGTARV